MSKAVVLLSGGIDSAACLGIACRTNDHIIPIHFQYGQQSRELEYAYSRQQVLNFQHMMLDSTIEDLRMIQYGDVFKHFVEGVVDDKEFGHMTEDDGRSSGYVPMRNLQFIATASAIADHEDANMVYHGAQQGDAEDYPDCSGSFMSTVYDSINESLPAQKHITLRTPLINSDKVEVIEMADKYGVHFEYTYSCYEEPDSIFAPEPCMDCPACKERKEAFEATKIKDPHQP